MKTLLKVALVSVLLACVALLLPAQSRRQATAPFRPLMTDWASRVVANGGAMPSQNTIIAMEALRVTLIEQGLTNKIWTLCVFVPDSVIAASTPLIKNKGNDPWTNSGFVADDLNINGLKGNFANYLDTGMIASSVQTNNNNVTTNVGISAIVTESATNAAQAIVLQQIFVPGNTAIGLFASGAGADQFYCGAVVAGDIQTNDFNRVGYISGQHLFTTNALFVASPVEAHKLLMSVAGTASSLQQFNSTFTFFGTRIQNTNNTANGLRLSMGCLHEGFTETESSNFCASVMACRASLGGGTGNPVHDWARYVTNFGGAAVSTTTSNALSGFRKGVDTDGMLYDIAAANLYSTDNLVAASMPILYQAGNQMWTNTAFGATNLTINGLTGNGTTKFLGTGIKPSLLTYGGFSDTDAGLSVLIYNVGTDANVFNVGSAGTTANGLFTVGNQLGNVVFFCWIFTTVNTDYVIRAAPNAGWEGFLSGNRTAANVIRLDWVTNGVHNVATNATGTTASNNNTMTNMFAHAIASGLNVAANLSDQTVSFLAVHRGLTQTKSSNLWIRVRDARNTMGGGVP